MIKRVLELCCVTILVAQVILCLPIILFFGSDRVVYAWFRYCFPLLRFGDYFVGCCLGKFYVQSNNSKISLKYSALEIVASIITVFVCLWENQGDT